MPPLPLKIALLSQGRSHMWDLFSSMDQAGADVTFYSNLPNSRLKKFGLNNQKVQSLFLDCFPVYALQKLNPFTSLDSKLDYHYLSLLDNQIAKSLMPCDLLIGLSGLTLSAAKTAKNKYRSQFWLERGSVHILEQKKILEAISELPIESRVPAWAVDRELEGYELADRIVVASSHVAQSFYDRGISAKKLFVNCYGVNLDDFPVTPMPQSPRPTLLFVGGWTYRKGCDLLSSFITQFQEVDLIHVGAPGDCPFPDVPNFSSAGHVFQKDLTHYYGRAHLLIHLSREEGMSLVLAQALASGLPMIATPLTGANDLIPKIAVPEAIKIVSDPTVENLISAVRAQLDRFKTLKQRENILGIHQEELSWRSSARKYLKEIESSFKD